MSGDTETLDLPGERARRSLMPGDAGLLLLANGGEQPIPAIVRLPPATLVLGRDPPSGGLRIEQGAVSKLHAQLTPAAGGVVLRDLGSRNGVFVNGERIDEVALGHGDLLHVGNALFKFVLQGIGEFEHPPPRPHGFEHVIAGPSLAHIMADLAVVARVDLAVLVLGETGTGKEVFARAVHAASGRTGRFVALNCAAIPAALLEAELFGARRGAFTGAERDREGLVRAADRGTLFLDEIGDMPLEAQAKVLRFIETKEVVPLGGTAAERSDARLVCATHHDLNELMARGRFRGDLLARIRQHAVRLPPLRERKEDVIPLLHHFLKRERRAELVPDFRCWVVLCHYHWPFNVRELEAVVRRAAALAKSGRLGEAELPDEVRACVRTYGERRSAIPSERRASAAHSAAEAANSPASAPAPSGEELRAMLVQHQGNVAALARHYNKDRAQVHRWLRRLGIVPEDFR